MLAKQVLSQLSYTPTVGAPFILKHFRRFQHPFLRFSVITVPKLYKNPWSVGLFASPIFLTTTIEAVRRDLKRGLKNPATGRNGLTP